MGSVTNNAIDTSELSASQIELEFEAVGLPHSNLSEGALCRVTVGALLNSESEIHLIQLNFTYTETAEPSVCSFYSSFAAKSFQKAKMSMMVLIPTGYNTAGSLGDWTI